MANTLAWQLALSVTVASPSTDETVITVVNQTAHGFNKGNAVFFNGTQWQAAQANSTATIGTHVVGEVLTANQFQAVKIGKITGLTGLTAGATYFVDPASPGAITVTEPSAVGEVSNPIGGALSDTVLEVIPYRAFEIN